MLELVGLGKSFDGVPAIRDVSLTVSEDEYLTLLGPSGSGKSTLLRLIAGLDKPDTGKILLNGEDVTYAPTHMRGLGFVQQKYALFPHLSVRENVAFGLRNHHKNPVTDEAEITKRCDEILEIVGLRGLGGRGVGQISGGQKQRISLARTLITRPKLCLLDEPLGALDANLRERMTIELRQIREELGVSFLHVTGNEIEALGMGDRMILLDQGQAIQIDRPAVIFAKPSSVEAARILNNYNIFKGKPGQGKLMFAGLELDLPPKSDAATYYAVGMDKITIGTPTGSSKSKIVSVEAKFIASEFMGSQVLYLFERPDGKVFEVARHLSREAPTSFTGGAKTMLSWDLGDVLTYDAAGHLLNSARKDQVAA